MVLVNVYAQFTESNVKRYENMYLCHIKNATVNQNGSDSHHKVMVVNT